MVRRLIAGVGVVAIMAAMIMAGPSATVGGPSFGPQEASAQVPGQTVSCSPWEQAWYVSTGGWWYYWWWRWCYNPSIQGGWYVDWAGWQWDGYAGPEYTPGFQYDTHPQ